MRIPASAATVVVLVACGLVAGPWTASAEPGDHDARPGSDVGAPGGGVAAPGEGAAAAGSPAPHGGVVASAPAGFRVHIVQPGETAFRIARRYGISVEALAAANRLADPARLRAGQVLRIPGGSSASGGPPQRGIASAPASGRPAQSTARASVSRQAVGYVVRPGDTLYSLARRTGASVAEIQRLNGLRDDRIHVGRVLRLPGQPTAGAPGVPQPVAEPSPAASAAPAGAVGSPDPASTAGRRIVPERPVAVFMDPHYDSAIAAVVDAGTPLTGGVRQGRWLQVSLSEGQVGWVLARDLGMEPATGPAVPGGPSARPSQVPGPREPPGIPGGRLQGDLDGLLADARRLVGVPYVWGGTSAQGADCSGFVWLVYAQRVAGLPRTSFEMFRVGTPVSREDLLPGDLVFFTTYAPGPSHVGIYMGDGQFAHASSRSRRVVVTPLSDAYYAARYLGARRILP